MARKRSTRTVAQAASEAVQAAERPKKQNPDEGAKKSSKPGGNGARTDSNPADDAQARVERAEQVIDQFAGRVAHYTSVTGRKLLRLGSRIREEAEDMWAEAQNIRKGGRP